MTTLGPWDGGDPRNVSSYDPRKHSARCDLCPLAGKPVVPAEPPRNGKRPLMVLIGEGPGRKEEIYKTAFIGQSGALLDDQLENVNVDRREVYVTNACLCRGDTDKEIDRATECCSPRLARELAALDPTIPIVALGKQAARSVLGTKSILLIRGFVWTCRDLSANQKTAGAALRKAEKKHKGVADARLKVESLDARQVLQGRTVFPTIHPAFVLRSDAWTPILRIDLDRAARWARGELKEEDLADRIERVNTVRALMPGTYLATDDAETLRAACAKLGPTVSADIETESVDPLSPLLVKILCAGISDGERTVVFGPWRPEIHRALLTEIMRGRTTVMHNGYNFDQPCLEKDGVRIDLAKVEDTLIAHHAFASHMPQRLDHVVSTFLDARPWKIRFGRRQATEKGLPPQNMEPDELYFYNACLDAGARVVLADGSTRSIAQIVHGREAVDVLTNSPSGITTRRVTAWHRRRVPGQTWVQLRVAGLPAASRGIIATPDHRIFTQRGWVEAEHVKLGDSIAQPERVLSSAERQALLGTLLGDSCLAVSPTHRGGVTAISSVVGSHEDTCGLAQHKHQATRGFIACAPAVGPGGSYPGSRPVRIYRTPMSVQVEALRPLIYDARGKRRIKRETLDALGPVGLAWWFMDDGCLQKGQRLPQNTGARGGRSHWHDSITIATNCFPRSDVDLAVAWFRARYGPVSAGKDKVLRLSARASLQFCRDIAPFVPEAMRYKFPRGHSDWPTYLDAPLSAEDLPYFAPLVFAGPYRHKRETKAQRMAAETRYCLTVDETHNFFTSSGLVANCDCVLTIKAWHAMQADLRPERAVYAHDKEIAALCKGLQQTGFPVDRKRRRTLSTQLKHRAAALKGRMRTVCGVPAFMPSRLGEVRHILFKRLRAPMLNPTSSGLASTSNATLEVLKKGSNRAARFSDALLRWRIVMKIRSTYLDAVAVHKDARAHYNWKSFGTVSGRFSCRMQSAPRWSAALEDRVREIYTAGGRGYELYYFDLSQAEARSAANLSGDPVFIDTCKGDVHAGNALVLFPEHAEEIKRDAKGKHCPRHSPEVGNAQAACNCGKPFRDVAKNAGFAVAYLAEAPTVFAYLRAQGFPVELGDVEAMLDSLKAAYKVYYRYVAENVAFVQRNGYLRTAITGRIRWFGYSPPPTEIANFPIQSLIADVMNTRLLILEKQLPLTAKIVGQYHDAAIVRGKRGDDRIVTLMEDLWKEPIRLPESVVCRQAREFLLPTEIKRGYRMSEF